MDERSRTLDILEAHLSATEKTEVGAERKPYQRALRPGRLEPAFAEDGRTSFTGIRHLSPVKAEAAELPVFRHLDALQKAVESGEALAGHLPELPEGLRREVDSSCAGRGVPQGASSLAIQNASSTRSKHGRTSVKALRATGEGLLAKNAILGYVFDNGESRVQRAPRLRSQMDTGAPPIGFGHSVLRGTPLHYCHRGPHASASWISTEKARLHNEAAKPFGSSALVAFLQNGGPQSMEPLGRELCHADRLRILLPAAAEPSMILDN